MKRVAILLTIALFLIGCGPSEEELHQQSFDAAVDRLARECDAGDGSCWCAAQLYVGAMYGSREKILAVPDGQSLFTDAVKVDSLMAFRALPYCKAQRR